MESRRIYFGKEKPTVEDIRLILEDYFNGAAEIIWPSKRRFMCYVQGHRSSPFRRIQAAREQDVNSPSRPEARWIEVIQETDDKLQISAKVEDELTNCLAVNLAEQFITYYKAMYEYRQQPIPDDKACFRCGAYTTTGFCSRQCARGARND